ECGVGSVWRSWRPSGENQVTSLFPILLIYVRCCSPLGGVWRLGLREGGSLSVVVQFWEVMVLERCWVLFKHWVSASISIRTKAGDNRHRRDSNDILHALRLADCVQTSIQEVPFINPP